MGGAEDRGGPRTEPRWDALTVTVLGLLAASHLAFIARDTRLPGDQIGLFAPLPAVQHALSEGGPGLGSLLPLLGDSGGWYNLLVISILEAVGPSPAGLMALCALPAWLMVLFTTLIARRLGGSRAATAAAALVGASPLAVAWGRKVWFHTPEAALIAGALALWLSDTGLRRWRTALGLALAGSLAMALRNTGLFWVLTLTPMLVVSARAGARGRLGAVVLPWALAALLPLRLAPSYLAGKLDTRAQYAAAVHPFHEQLGFMLGWGVVALGGLGVLTLLGRRELGGRRSLLPSWARSGGLAPDTPDDASHALFVSTNALFEAPAAAPGSARRPLWSSRSAMIYGLLEHRGPLLVLGLWLLAPPALVLAFQAGLDNHMLVVVGLAALGGLGLSRLHALATLSAVVLFLGFHALATLPHTHPLRVATGGVLGPLPSEPHADLHRPTRAFGAPELSALFEATCADKPPKGCFVLVHGGLLQPFSDSTGQLELYLLGEPRARLVPLHHRRPQGLIRGPAHAMASLSCAASDDKARWTALHPDDDALARKVIEERGFEVAWSQEVGSQCSLRWFAPPEGLPAPEALPQSPGDDLLKPR